MKILKIRTIREHFWQMSTNDAYNSAMFWFASASLLPAICLIAACLFGGLWPLVSVLSITVFVFGMDRFVARSMPDVSEGDGGVLCYVITAVHGLLWLLGLWAIGHGTHLSVVDKLLLGTGLGLFFGQISSPTAHELIHKRARLPHWVGTGIYISVLFGHHTSAHLRVHHIHAATHKDPNTARLGEGFWRFLLRAVSQEFTAGLRAENKLRSHLPRGKMMLTHPYVAYVGGAIGVVALAAQMGGMVGVLALFALAVYAQFQLYLSDYVQHYGLIRRIDASGRTEPMGTQHSWNAPHWYSSAMMLNAPRHSDHHVSPTQAYPGLQLDSAAMPTLPHSLPVMAVLALIPPVWRRLMDPQVQQWQQDIPQRQAA